MKPSQYYIYDLETMKSCFLFIGKFVGDNELQVFEISSRRNDRDKLLAHLSYIQNCKSFMVGFNNLGFDEPIINELMHRPATFDNHKAYLMGQEIINRKEGYGFVNRQKSDRLIDQIDLSKINHFDNFNKRVSLKSLEFAMRSESVEDLPYDVDRDLTSEEMDKLVRYGVHDVEETKRFFHKCKHLIDMRHDLLVNGVIGGDVLNYSDVKIGVEYLVRKIGRTKCFSGSQPKQTPREVVVFKDIILPKIFFRTEPFQAVYDWFNSQTIRMDSDERPTLKTSLGDVDFHFGVGGVHASVVSRIYESSDTHVIRDIDVGSMYVSVATANGFYPEHLGKDFVAAYKQLQADRKQYSKGSSMNAVLKLAGNGVYGNSNNQYSVFYDPKYTFSVTVNGQLQLLQLVEVLSLIPGLELIQANTDGITAYVPRNVAHLFDLWCRDWESITGLQLEEVEYKKMWIRDVNNYVALKPDGSVKSKGAYWYPKTERDYEGYWNKDYSNMICQKAIEQVLVNGHQAKDLVALASNPFDFMLRYKTPAGATVYLGDEPMPKTVRYYVSTNGKPMKKVSKPKGEIGTYKRKNSLSDEYYNQVLSEIPKYTWDARIHTANKSKYEQVTTSIESGWLISECNRADKFDWTTVDSRYYINEINKLIIGDSRV